MKKTPQCIIERPELKLRQGIKSSLSNIRSVVGLLYSLYSLNDKKAYLEYSDEYKSGERTLIRIKQDLLNLITSEFPDITEDIINNQPLFKSQIEALQVGVELFFKLGKVSFNTSYSNSIERTGGNRYNKNIKFSTNIKIIDIYLSSLSEQKRKDFLISWLQDNPYYDISIENAIIRILTIFTEETQFKIRYQNKDIIFQQEGIYNELCSANSVRSNDEKELVGPYRVFKSYVKDNLHPFISDNHGEFVIKQSIQNEFIEYSHLVSNCLNLIPKRTIIIEEKEINTSTLINEIVVHNNSFQQIYFGAPGTGKSHCVKKETESLNKEGRVIRTTFHPDSDYSTFVGAYKPTTESMPRYDIYNKPMVRTDGVPIMEQVITYEFVEQAFLQAYIDAWKNREKPEFLIIEEINRGNCAQIFGDLFQLLDRGDDGYSEYAVRADKDLQKFICKALDKVNLEDYPNVKEGKELLLPSNLFIRATMNTSDQSLFPIDSAFKRRWDWQYIPIAKGNDNGVELNWAIDVDGTKYDWWSFVKTMNKYVFDMTNSEDKQLGFFFCKAKNNIISSETFVSKVIFYLWNDVFKDFGFDDSIFTDKDDVDNPNLSFDKFYNSDRTINIEKIIIFLSNIGLTPLLDFDDNNDFLDEDGNSSNTGTKDYSRYSINGEGSYNKGKVVQKAVEIYVENNSNMTADEIVHKWKTLDVTSVPHFVESKEEYNMRMQNAKDKNSRANPISVPQGGEICVSNQYNLINIQEVITKINAAGWDINIEKV